VRKESNFQIVPQLGGGLAANVAVFLQSLVDDPFQFGWYVGIQPNWSYGSAFQNSVEDQPRSVASKRQGTSAHLVQNRTKREQVGAGI
jgi:hypothetical protein